MKNMSEEGPVCEWKTLGVGVLFLIVAVAVTLYAIFFSLDHMCLVIDIIIFVLAIAGAVVVLRNRLKGKGV